MDDKSETRMESPNHLPADSILAEFDSICNSCINLRSRSVTMEETIDDLRIRNRGLSKTLEDVSRERDELRAKVLELEPSVSKERSELDAEVQLSRDRLQLIEEKGKRERVSSECLDSIRLAREALVRVRDRICEDKLEKKLAEGYDFGDELQNLVPEARLIGEMSLVVESKFLEYEEKTRKEKKELENSIVSLTEENRDINSLLRIALAEKESVEKSLSRAKGGGEQKRVAILQIAERGLQKVGFGFMMGASSVEGQSDQPCASSESTKSDTSECEEEVISLVATVEKIMRGLRIQISDLRLSLEESRSDNERLQILFDKQAAKLTENTLYTADLEEREKMQSHYIEELMAEITEAREEVARWREACELEVEAGKVAIEEREREVTMLQQELRRTTSALYTADSKLKLKERLADTAMAAQAAAEASLQLSDSRSAGLRERIEELTRQVEEEADHTKKDSSRKRVRRVCWPWRALKFTPNWQATGDGGASWILPRNRKMLPGMESLLHYM